MEQKERIELYEPFFDEWKIVKLLKEYDHISFLEIVNNFTGESAVLKVITILGDERKIDYEMYNLLMNGVFE